MSHTLNRIKIASDVNGEKFKETLEAALATGACVFCRGSSSSGNMQMQNIKQT